MGHRGKGKHSEAAEGEGQVRPVPVGPLEEDAARGALFLPGQLLQPGGQAGKLGGEGVQRRLIGRRAGQAALAAPDGWGQEQAAAPRRSLARQM